MLPTEQCLLLAGDAGKYGSQRVQFEQSLLLAGMLEETARVPKCAFSASCRGGRELRPQWHQNEHIRPLAKDAGSYGSQMPPKGAFSALWRGCWETRFPGASK